MSLRIVIVGGVAGGASAAARGRRLSEAASITIFEKGPHVSFANCGIPYVLGGVIADKSKLLLQTPESMKARYNLDVRTNTEVTRIDREHKRVHYHSAPASPASLVGVDPDRSLPYDKLILALGAEAVRPPMEGADAPHVYTLQTIPDLQRLNAAMDTGQVHHAVIIGGGFIGLEAAENIRLRGVHTTIVEMTPQVFAPVDEDIAAEVHAELRKQGVELLLSTRVQRIIPPKGDDRGGVELAGGERLPADIVLMAVGVRPRTALAHDAGLRIGSSGGIVVNGFMQTNDPDIYAVGDMVESKHTVSHSPVNIALAGPANRQGRLAADHIFGKGAAYRGTIGTSVCQVFDLTVGNTGMTTRELSRLKRPFRWVTVHPPHHAGYYPGGKSMTLKLIFDPDDGRILGAQAVGRAGIDKRIDVLSTAIQARMTVDDLETLELAYAPPYGAAKDPINMAGFVAGDLMRGEVEILHSTELKGALESQPEIQLVDVRNPGEFTAGHLQGATNIPLNGLRGRMEELPKDRPVVVYCQVGFRGYLAARILQQNGYTVQNLDGGYLSAAAAAPALVASVA